MKKHTIVKRENHFSHIFPKARAIMKVPWSCGVFVCLVFEFFFFDSTACAILVLQPGIELAPPTVEAQSLNY